MSDSKNMNIFTEEGRKNISDVIENKAKETYINTEEFSGLNKKEGDRKSLFNAINGDKILIKKTELEKFRADFLNISNDVSERLEEVINKVYNISSNGLVKGEITNSIDSLFNKSKNIIAKFTSTANKFSSYITARLEDVENIEVQNRQKEQQIIDSSNYGF